MIVNKKIEFINDATIDWLFNCCENFVIKFNEKPKKIKINKIWGKYIGDYSNNDFDYLNFYIYGFWWFTCVDDTKEYIFYDDIEEFKDSYYEK